ncbi:MAG TPA: cupin domain-containing protein [Haliangiales bacterium]|nr:cupin domain-containing protein [Haliangiales bacterium]
MAIGPEGDPSDYLDAETFHREIRRVYAGPLSWAVNKERGRMAKVLYRAPHENAAETGARRGAGNDWARWIFAEEPGIAEGIFRAPLELVIDARLEPGACIGLHWHRETEEVYYLLEGTLTMTTVAEDGREETRAMAAGDAHAVTLGQGHFGVAGEEGARFVAISVRVK